MSDLINIAVVVATLFGCTVAADKIFVEVRKAAYGTFDAHWRSK